NRYFLDHQRRGQQQRKADRQPQNHFQNNGPRRGRTHRKGLADVRLDSLGWQEPRRQESQEQDQQQGIAHHEQVRDRQTHGPPSSTGSTLRPVHPAQAG